MDCPQVADKNESQDLLGQIDREEEKELKIPAMNAPVLKNQGQAMSMRPKTVGSNSLVFNSNLGKKDNKSNNKLSGQAELLRNKVNDFNGEEKLSPAESACKLQLPLIIQQLRI